MPNEPFSIYIGGWQPPLGIRLSVTGAGLLLTGFSCFLFLLISFFARSQASASFPRTFWPLLLSLQTGITGLFFTHDLFNAYIFLEITGICSVGLVALSPGDKSYKTAFNYLSVNIVGSLCFLFGVALIYRTYGVLDFIMLDAAIDSAHVSPIAYLSVFMIITGLVVKSALAPLHGWLPEVHGSAMPLVSALLSGLVVKCGIYLFFVLWWTTFSSLITPPLIWVLSLCGAAGIIIGTIRALQADHLKQMAAYSTVAQIGYLFLFMPIISQSEQLSTEIFAGFLLFIVAHGLAKTTLFLAVGYLKSVHNCVTPSSLAGFAQQQPLIVGAIAVSAISLIGLPPSGGFTAKWALLSFHASAGSWALFTTILVGSILSAVCFFNIMIHAISAPPAPEYGETIITNGLLQQRVIIVLLSVLTVLSGFCWPLFAHFLRWGAT